MSLLSLSHWHCGLTCHCLWNPPAFPHKPGLKPLWLALVRADREAGALRKTSIKEAWKENSLPMNNNLEWLFLFTPPCSHSAILSGDRAAKALGGIAEKPQRTDCLAAAHPFFKHQQRKDTSPALLPPPAALHVKGQSGVCCVFCVPGGLSEISEGIWLGRLQPNPAIY